jgi:hypothetical protein
MRIHYFAPLAVLAFAFSTAAAQNAPRTFGVGVSLNPSALVVSEDAGNLFLPVGFTNITLPITISENFRIEPEFGILTTNSYDEASGLPTVSRDNTTSATRFGTGIFYRMPIAESFAAYAGPRVGLQLINNTVEAVDQGETSTRTRSQTNIHFGGAVGGEYMLSQHFSLGAEAQLNYVSMGEITTTYEPEPIAPPTEGGESSQSLFATNALIFARFYF